MDFAAFFDIYMRPRSGQMLRRDGIEFRYAAAALLIACSRSDTQEHPDETRVIREILEQSFNISTTTIARLLEFADKASQHTYLEQVTQLINRQFSDTDKHFILEKLWCVAYADGRIEEQESAFIDRVAAEISLDELAVEKARELAQHRLQPGRT